MAPIDPTLLEHARTTGARVIDAETELQIAKAEYHADVRRLHLAGASLREIAVALGMSHQRVQQIVQEAGGSWWSKVWRNRTDALRDTTCSFCARTRAQVDKLISGPDFFMCDVCIDRAERVAKHHTDHAPFSLAPRTDKARCSFCGERQQREKDGTTRLMVRGGARHTCTTCLVVCRSILDETT
ncbi:MAG: ClpX C4-type zinc finger protein [Kofleriaceae bacterium]